MPSQCLVAATSRISLGNHRQVRHWLPFAVACLQHLASNPFGLHTSQWVELSSWFAPVNGEHFWIRVAWLCSQECVKVLLLFLLFIIHITRWFFGRISTESAVSIAAQHLKTPGAWLLRFSSSEKGGLAFTVAEKNEKITHYRVSREWERGGEFVLRMRPSDRRYENLAALLVGAQEALHLKSPICGSLLRADVLRTQTEAVSAAMHFDLCVAEGRFVDS